jgi:hypothetical protein
VVHPRDLNGFCGVVKPADYTDVFFGLELARQRHGAQLIEAVRANLRHIVGALDRTLGAKEMSTSLLGQGACNHFA